MPSFSYLPINGVTQGVHHPAQQGLPNWYIDNGPCSLYHVTFFDQLVVAKHYNTNVIWFQVQCHAL